MEIDAKFDFEEACSLCGGCGMNHHRKPSITCQSCKGSGTNITSEGQKLGDFLIKYFGLKPTETIKQWDTFGRGNLPTFQNPFLTDWYRATKDAV